MKQRRFTGRQALIAMSRPRSMPPVEPEEHPPSGSFHFKQGYTVERERALRLARIFTAIDKARPQGNRTMHKAFVHAAWKWDGKPYACDPARRMHAAEGTLRCLYYTRWLAGGRTPEALIRRWRCGRQRVISPGQVIEIARLCIESRTITFAAGYTRAIREGRISTSASLSAFCYATPAAVRTALAALHRHRRQEKGLLRKVTQAIGRFEAESAQGK